MRRWLWVAIVVIYLAIGFWYSAARLGRPKVQEVIRLNGYPQLTAGLMFFLQAAVWPLCAVGDGIEWVGSHFVPEQS